MRTIWFLIVSALLVSSEAIADETESRYSGPNISIEFKDTPVESALRMLADIKQMNFVLDPDVSGTITLKLSNVPWKQALELVLRQKGLALEPVGKEPLRGRTLHVVPLR